MTQRKISTHQSVDDILISIDTAMPFGLVVNELMLNSIKHAFPDDRNGDIWIEVHCRDEVITLEYRDNGVGLPYGFDPAAIQTLGLRIVQNIVRLQLGGDITIYNDEGFNCRIHIKTNLYRKRI